MSTFSLLTSLSCSVAQWLLESKKRKDDICIRDYLEWLRRQDQMELLQLIEQTNDSFEAINYLISQNFDMIESVRDELAERIESHDENTQVALADIRNILEGKLSLAPPDQGRVAIAHGVLETLAKGISDPHVRVIFRKDHGMHKQGSMINWIQPKLHGDWTVMDLVGDIQTNRISIIVRDDKSVELRLLSNVGQSIRTCSVAGAVSAGKWAHIGGTWDTDAGKMSLYINGQLAQEVADNRIALDFLGPALLIGADIEGKTSQR